MIARIFQGYYLTSDGRVTRFAESELTCRCGCGLSDMREEAIDALHKSRTQLNHPITPTSGVRCPAWNEHEGGHAESAHLDGFAIDMRSTIDIVLLRGYLKRWFRQVGMYSRSLGLFCHADMKPGGVRVSDVYTQDGKFSFDDFLVFYRIEAEHDMILEIMETT